MTKEEFNKILAEVKTGTEFEAIMQNNIELKGKIYVDKNVFYLCHNNGARDGNKAPDKLGYRYSWIVNNENHHSTLKTFNIITNNNEVITDYNIF